MFIRHTFIQNIITLYLGTNTQTIPLETPSARKERYVRRRDPKKLYGKRKKARPRQENNQSTIWIEVVEMASDGSKPFCGIRGSFYCSNTWAHQPAQSIKLIERAERQLTTETFCCTHSLSEAIYYCWTLESEMERLRVRYRDDGSLLRLSGTWRIANELCGKIDDVWRGRFDFWTVKYGSILLMIWVVLYQSNLVIMVLFVLSGICWLGLVCFRNWKLFEHLIIMWVFLNLIAQLFLCRKYLLRSDWCEAKFCISQTLYWNCDWFVFPEYRSA